MSPRRQRGKEEKQPETGEDHQSRATAETVRLHRPAAPYRRQRRDGGESDGHAQHNGRTLRGKG